MMLKRIQDFIKSENYIKANELIDLELKKSFDLSKENERIIFDELNKLKDDIIFSLSSDNVKYVGENFRSSSNHDGPMLRPQMYEERYLECLKSVELQIMPYKSLVEQDITIQVLLKPNLVQNNDDDNFTYLSEAGLYIDNPGYEGFDQIYLRGYSKNNDVNIKSTVDGLNNILSGLLEDGKENIIIYFPINIEEISESALFLVLFSALTSMIYFIINAETQLNKPLKIYWAFDELNMMEFFKKVITKAKIIKAKSQIIDGTLNHLQKDVHTKSEKYVKQLRSIAHIIDEVDVPILILGETGVGKSFLADIIHKASSRKGKFISLNCATIPDELVESELNGIEKSVATGVAPRPGKIKAAEGGTLFLDEIDRASKKFRDTILTFIDTKEYTSVGATTQIQADVRLIYGSNKDFQKIIAQKEFEIDFLNRINERIINIPPLRERPEDIEAIIEFILKDLNERKGSDIGITSDVISRISKMELKGNIRDLNKIIKYGFYESLYQDKFGIISLSQYEEYKDNVFSYNRLSEEFYQLLDIAKTLMLNYKPLKRIMPTDDADKFFIIKDFIMPIFAHVFLNDIYDEKNNIPNKSLSEQICGSSMERGKAATIRKKSEDFQNLQKLF